MARTVKRKMRRKSRLARRCPDAAGGGLECQQRLAPCGRPAILGQRCVVIADNGNVVLRDGDDTDCTDCWLSREAQSAGQRLMHLQRRVEVEK